MKVLSSFLFVLLLLSAQSGHGVVLDRDQLAAWYPNYLTDTLFYLAGRQITSISTGTFTGLTQLQRLNLFNNLLTSLDASIFNGLSQLRVLELTGNQLTSLDASIFAGLTQLQQLWLQNNNLISLDRNIFIGLLNLETVYLFSNPISSLQPSLVKQLCSTNPFCTVYI